MRIETTVIDGLDGDIRENLGFDSYDKIMKIALTRNFNINEIIQYLSGKGEIIFSNEPDKFYNAEIVESIDFERLIKFRIATVKIHVQPYKYLVYEAPVSLEITNEYSVFVENVGIENSKPVIILFGDGIVEISINYVAIFQINIDDEFVIIDSLLEESYKGNVLKNRLMTGEFPKLQVGGNIISWTGNLTRIIVKPKPRWL